MSPALTPLERAALLGIARGAVRAHLGLGPPPALPAAAAGAGRLGQPGCAFVTLRVRGELRGCVGTFTADAPLGEVVARVAVSAAAEDPRFPPLAAEELEELDVHVSVLGERRRMREVSELKVGRDGVLVRAGRHRGTLLPQVAVEQGWNADTFLERTCLKAGLPPQAWREPSSVVELFEAEEVGAATEAPSERE